MLDSKNFSFNIYALPVFLVGCLILWIGLFIFFQQRKSPINVSFGLLCLSLAVWMCGASFMYFANTAAVAIKCYKYISFLGVVSIMANAYLFSSVWVGMIKNKRREVFLSFIISCIFYILAVRTDLVVTSQSNRFFWGFYPVYGKLAILFLIIFGSLFACLLHNLYVGHTHEYEPSKKNQIKMIIVGFIIGFIASVDFIPKFTNIPLYPFGYVPILIFCCIVGYSLIKYKIFDIETVFHKTLLWLAVSSAVLLPIVVLLYFVKHWIARSPSLEVAIFFTIIFFLSMAYVRMVQPKIDHIFHRRKFDLEEALNKFVDELIHLRGLDELINKIKDTVNDTLYPENINIFLYDETRNEFKPTDNIHSKQTPEFSAENEFLSWIFKNNKIVEKEFIYIDPVYTGVKETAERYFNEHKGVLVIPLVLNERPLGIIDLGRKINLRRYNSFDLEFLMRIKNESIIALSNSLLYDSLEEKVAERTHELMQMQKQLVQAEKLATIGTLAGGVAHEINNPLTAILTNVQMMLAGSVNSEDRESLELMEEATKRCRTIVQKLMMYARKPLEERKISQIDLVKMVLNVVTFLEYQFQQDNVKIEVDSKEPLMYVSGNQNELEQVITNILLNSRDAIKALKISGKIWINIYKKAKSAVIEIIDEGQGILLENIPKIFDPFFTTKDIGKGTGLGLSICQAIVEKHNGRILVESKPGKGAIFKVELPYEELTV